MVKVTLRHGENWTTIEFPCSEQELQKTVDRLHGGHSDDMELFVAAVHFPKELKVLQDRFVNLDELNYLGRRLAGFWGNEASRFAEAVKLEAASSVREMINIVCNLNRYVLITDVSDHGKVGQEYIFQTEGWLPADYKTDPKYAAFGIDLMNSGNGVITDRGILFVDRERPMEQQYSGSTFPQFLDDPHCFMIAQISYQGQTEYANLPVEKLALEKAMRRLGAPSMSACQITLDHMDQRESAFHKLCDLTLLRDGIYMVNHWLQAIDSYVSPENHMVFDAAFTASGMKTMQDAVKVAENIESFYFAKDVKNDADLGKWWLEHYTKFTISPELQQFFDYRAYGEYLSQFLDVHYLECSDCVFLDGTTMDEVLGIVPGEEMKMGGMQMDKYSIRPLSDSEKPLFYSMTSEENAAHGCVGHLRMDFGRSGDEFWSTWWPRGPEELNSPSFKSEFDSVVNELRKTVLSGMIGMRRFCADNGGYMDGGWAPNYGYVIDTPNYRYCLRCIPMQGDYNAYILCA